MFDNFEVWVHIQCLLQKTFGLFENISFSYRLFWILWVLKHCQTKNSRILSKQSNVLPYSISLNKQFWFNPFMWNGSAGNQGRWKSGTLEIFIFFCHFSNNGFVLFDFCKSWCTCPPWSIGYLEEGDWPLWWFSVGRFH